MAKIKYPAVMPSDDKKAIKRGNAVLKQMTPKEFLHEARPLNVGHHDKDIIHTFEDDIEAGHHLGPLKLYEDGKEDGRHRANAAKKLGVKKVPVVDYRAKKKKKKAAGGAINVPNRLPLDDEDPNAAFRRLIAWSFAAAPLWRHGAAEGGAQGGVNSIEEAIRAADAASGREGMSHERGMSGAVEFAPVGVTEPLSGARLPLGSLPKETARVVEPTLQAASEIAPYFTPAAPIAAARDVAVGLREGDPTNVALSALGLPGKAAKAAAIGASALMPEDAEAGALSTIGKVARSAIPKAAPVSLEQAMKRVVSPFSDEPEQVRRALELARDLRIEQEAAGPKASYYNIGQSRPVKDVTTTIGDIPGLELKPQKQMSWEDVYNLAKGGTLINMGGDRSNFGRLTHINEQELAWPVDLHAGPKYALEPSPGSIWANDPGVATGFKNAVRAASEKGDVYGVYTPMSPTAVDSSHNMFETLMAQIPNQKITKKAAKEFDEAIKSGAHFATDKEKAKAIEELKDWPGINNPKAASDFAKNLSGGHRRALVQFMDKSAWRDKGFPMVGETRVAITDPEVLATPKGMMGHRIVKFNPQNITPETTTFEHSTYPVPTGGEYVGDVPPVLRHYAMPDVIDTLAQQPARDLSIIHPFSVDPRGRDAARKFFEEQKLKQEINQRFLDSVMKGVERRSQYGLKRGGSVDDDRIEDALSVVSNLS